jgi:hypothetical protein
MKLSLLLPAALSFVLLTSAVAATDNKGIVTRDPMEQYYFGNGLFDICRNHPNDGACWGYIAGIADVMRVNERFAGTIGGWSACIPDVPATQLVDVDTHFLREHPEARHTAASMLVAGAMADAFECPPTTTSSKPAPTN